MPQQDPDRRPRYALGYDAHPIQARLAGDTPWHWRRGVVRDHSDGVFRVDYLDESGSVEVWSARHPGAPTGTAVRVHEVHGFIDVAGTWISVKRVSGGLGAAPAPADPQQWARQRRTVITDFAAGTAFTATPVVDDSDEDGPER